MKRYEEDGYLITEYPSGTVIRELINEITEPVSQTEEPSQLDRIEEKLATSIEEQKTIAINALVEDMINRGELVL